MVIVQMGRVDGYNPQNSRKDSPFSWTNVYEEESTASMEQGLKKVIFDFFILQ